MNMTEPMCIIGASMGGAIVCMFAIKYPEYISMICLLAPVGKFDAFDAHVSLFTRYLLIKIANEECETDLIRQLRSGVYNALLPETPAQLRQMINTLTVKRIRLPGPFLNGFLQLRLRLLEEHKKSNVQKRLFQFRCFQCLVLTSLLEYDYPHIEHQYQQLRQLDRPALILWGRQDQVKQRNYII
jgi:pimeloyl-ACP methyl ester carboxylesterase